MTSSEPRRRALHLGPKISYATAGMVLLVTSYAQNAEDVPPLRLFASKPEGFYVDVGAGDPVQHSVTKLFYDAGWNGINVEPGPTFDRLALAGVLATSTCRMPSRPAPVKRRCGSRRRIGGCPRSFDHKTTYYRRESR